jgi:hypothetical protein
MRNITIEMLTDRLECDTATGVFKWKPHPKNVKHMGKDVGRVSNTGYVQIGLDGGYISAHRMVMIFAGFDVTGKFVDHINGIRTDNRLENLRLVTSKENGQNQRMPERNTSGVCGVTWHKKVKKWQATIKEGKTLHYLGLFSDLDEAKKAREDANKSRGFHVNHGIQKLSQLRASV